MAAAFITTTIDSGTAAVCRDNHRLQPYTEPARKRAWVRLAVVLAVLGITAWVVVLIATTSSPTYSRKQVDYYRSKEAQAYFLPVPPDPFLTAPSDGMIPPNIICPCLGQPTMSWCQFIDFFFITCNQDTNYQPHVTPISTSSSGSCYRQPLDLPFAKCSDPSNLLSCTSALGAIYDFVDTKTYIDTPNLASTFRVFDIVSREMQSNIHTSNQTIHTSGLNLSNQKEYNYSMLMLSLVQSMVTQVFECNISSTAQQFWDKAIQCGWDIYPELANQFNDTKFAFGMTINYQAYSTTCKPDKCYIYEERSFKSRLFQAMGEVGGIGSIILLGLQIIIWPLVAKIFKFPFENDPQIGTVASTLSNHRNFFQHCCGSF